MSNNRALIKYDNNYLGIQESALDMAFRGDYLAGTNLIYKGFARPGSPTSQEVWQIAMLTYDGNNNVTAIQWPTLPNGSVSSDYLFEWDDRAAYTYV